MNVLEMFNKLNRKFKDLYDLNRELYQCKMHVFEIDLLKSFVRVLSKSASDYPDFERYNYILDAGEIGYYLDSSLKLKPFKVKSNGYNLFMIDYKTVARKYYIDSKNHKKFEDELFSKKELLEVKALMDKFEDYKELNDKFFRVVTK